MTDDEYALLNAWGKEKFDKLWSKFSKRQKELLKKDKDFLEYKKTHFIKRR